MTGDLEGKVAIVTGGARGIGAATVEALCRDGASAVVADVLDDEGRAFVARLARDGKAVRYAHLDVSDAREWERVVAETVRDLGHLDILVNNAGIGTFADIEQETSEGWAKVIAVDETGVWLGMRAAVPRMREAGGGAIVNVSSIFGEVGGFGGSIAYHAAKGAVGTMSRNAAVRYAKDGIRVNSIHPGFIGTPMTAGVRGTPLEAVILEKTPLGRWGRPEEIGDVIAFMCGPRASFMTGSEIYVDGGWTAT